MDLPRQPICSLSKLSFGAKPESPTSPAGPFRGGFFCAGLIPRKNAAFAPITGRANVPRQAPVGGIQLHEPADSGCDVASLRRAISPMMRRCTGSGRAQRFLPRLPDSLKPIGAWPLPKGQNSHISQLLCGQALAGRCRNCAISEASESCLAVTAEFQLRTHRTVATPDPTASCTTRLQPETSTAAEAVLARKEAPKRSQHQSDRSTFRRRG